MTDIREYLKNNRLLFDGGMGTLCAERMPSSSGTPCELWNLSHPDLVSEIHADYLRAGARAIKTNTFGANRLAMDEASAEAVIRAGYELAMAYESRAYVFADIGPLTVTDNEDLLTEYRFVCDIFLSLGAKHFLFETQNDPDALQEISAYLKSRCPEAFILISFASLPDGFTRVGRSVKALLSEAAAWTSVDAVGLNCVSGAGHMARLAASLSGIDKPLSFMPNAGYPTVLGNRTFYDGDPSYFAAQLGKMIAHGATILGGCCGTTPKHIEAAAAVLDLPHIPTEQILSAPSKKADTADPFWQALEDPDKRPFAVELDPPENADIEKFLSGAKELAAAGASVITIADCPIARARMDASLLACKLERELGIKALPHMTCRDRNLNATRALLLGLCAEGIHQVLAVTGDPIPTLSRDEVKSVYNFNSRMLASYIRALGEDVLSTPFRVFGALNVNAHNFSVQLRLAKEKEEAGMCGFLTQPILTEQAFENLKRARQELKGKLLGGIFPPVSHRNARFMSSEVTGIRVDERIISLYEGKDREEGEALALDLSCRIADAIRPYVDGYYLMTPFSRTPLMARLMKKIEK